LEFNNRIGLLFFGVFLLLILIFSGSSGNSSFTKIKKVKKQIAQKELVQQKHTVSFTDVQHDLEEVQEDEESIEVDEIIEYEVNSAAIVKDNEREPLSYFIVQSKMAIWINKLVKNYPDSPAMPPEMC
jgi:hypothetical protein